jgi:hypothetical protein
VLHLMQKIRDESHRFAVTYHRKRREMRDRDSELLSIPGVGAADAAAADRALRQRARHQAGSRRLTASPDLFALIKLAVHVAANLWEAHIGYGYFRDEFYYIACGRHLAWGYVDHGPIVAVQARISELVFGKSLAGLRFLSALAGATKVFLTGMLAWALGGRRPAQGLAMLGVLLVPQYLGIDSFLSMNSFEPVFWMTCLLALVLMLRENSSQKLWLLFGVSGGIGVLNKPSMAFFLGSSCWRH